MARLSAPFTLSGSFGGLVAYQRKDLPGTLVRTPTSITRKRFRTDPAFANSRRTATEGGGRSKAAQALRRVLRPLAPVRDHNWQGALTGGLTGVQHGDTESRWGQRSVLFSRHGHLLEGWCLSQRTPFETLLRAPLACHVDKDALGARVTIPAMIQDLDFFPRTQHPYFCLIASLGVVPDLHYTPNGYAPAVPPGRYPPQVVRTGWTGVKMGLPETGLELQLPYPVDYPSYALVLAVAITFGTPDGLGRIQPVPYCGSGRLARVV